MLVSLSICIASYIGLGDTWYRTTSILHSPFSVIK
jgi:hypothetical protein